MLSTALRLGEPALGDVFDHGNAVLRARVAAGMRETVSRPRATGRPYDAANFDLVVVAFAGHQFPKCTLSTAASSGCVNSVKVILRSSSAS